MKERIGLIFSVVMVWHLTKALLLIFVSDNTLRITTGSGFSWMGQYGAGFFLLIASGASILAALSYQQRHIRLALGLLIPQQLALFFSASGALTATLNQHYADGVIRDWDFILPDQQLSILVCVGHLIEWSLLLRRG